MRQTKTSIITYHSIDESRSVISISSKVFRQQMKFLKENNFNIVSLKVLGQSLLRKEALPPNSVVLTFDDGFENFFTTAFPILIEYGFTATVFLITDFCGKINNWSGNLATVKQTKLMDWNQIKELNKYNFDFGAHTCTHPDLTSLSLAEAERELTESKLVIEEKLGSGVTDLAYPYGIYNNPIKELTARHYISGCTTKLGRVQSDDNRYSIRRLDAYYLQNNFFFSSILSGNLDLYLGFRQTVRRLRSL